MGPFEVVLDFLYGRFGLPHQGLIVALGYRIISVVIAFVGVCYYLGSRQEVAAVMHDEEAQEQDDRLTCDRGAPQSPG